MTPYSSQYSYNTYRQRLVLIVDKTFLLLNSRIPSIRSVIARKNSEQEFPRPVAGIWG